MNTDLFVIHLIIQKYVNEVLAYESLLLIWVSLKQIFLNPKKRFRLWDCEHLDENFFFMYDLWQIIGKSFLLAVLFKTVAENWNSKCHLLELSWSFLRLRLRSCFLLEIFSFVFQDTVPNESYHFWAVLLHKWLL